AIGGSLRKKSQLLFVFILLEGTEHLICLVLDGISCVGNLFLSICNNLLGLAFVRCLFIACNFAVGFLCLADELVLLFFVIALYAPPYVFRLLDHSMIRTIHGWWCPIF